MIGVKNNSGETIEGRFDGRDYKFQPGVPVAVPPDVARHIFGFGMEDKSRALHRLGWMKRSDQYQDALKKLNDIQFLSVENQFHEGADMPRNTKALADPQADESKIATEKPDRRRVETTETKIDIPQFGKAAK